MNLEQRIQAERNKVANQVTQLREQNQVDQENLDELKQEYNAAILSSDENEIDYVNNQIKEVSGRITRRNDMIKALQDQNNPIIQSLVSDEMAKYLDGVKDVEGQAFQKLKDLENAHQELLNGLDEVNELYRKSKQYRHFINYYLGYLSDGALKNFGLSKPGVDNLGPLPNEMRKLFVADHQVFKR